VTGLLGFLAMGVYVPRVRVERVYAVVPVRHPGSPIVSTGRTGEVREIREEPAGYGWVWSTPREPAWFGSELAFRLDWLRLGLQAAAWSLVVLSAVALRPWKGGRHGAEGPAEPDPAPDPVR
jgi:hypothetical protein